MEIYNVTDDVKNQKGEWVEFFEIDVVRLDDVNNLLKKYGITPITKTDSQA